MIPLLAVAADLRAAGAGLIWWRFEKDGAATQLSASLGSTFVPLQAIPGSDSGFDQSMPFAAPG